MRRIGIFIVFCFLAMTVCIFALDVEDYMPLSVGNSWTYADSSEMGCDTTISRICGTTTMLDYLTHVFVDSSIVTDSVDTSYMQLRGDALYSLVTFEEEDTNYMEQKVLPDPFQIGDEWVMMLFDSSWTEGTATYCQHIEMNGEAIALENITVPAGTFMNCVKITMVGFYTILVMVGSDTMYYGEGSIGEHTLWTGEGIGPVKFYDMEIEEDETTETYTVLLDYDVTGINGKPYSMPDCPSIKLYPNPFNSSCRIQVSGIGNQESEIEIYDLRGNVVWANGVRPTDEGRIVYAPTSHTFIWQPDETISSGIYLVKTMTEDGQKITKRIVYLR